MTGSDINGKQAQSWSRADMSKIWTPADPQSKPQLFKDTKEAVLAQMKLLCPGKNDDAYRSIVDLIMLRVHGALQDFIIASNAVDAECISQDVYEQLIAALNKKYTEMQTCSVKDAADYVIQSVQDIILLHNDKNNNTLQDESAEEEESEEEIESIIQNNEEDMPFSTNESFVASNTTNDNEHKNEQQQHKQTASFGQIYVDVAVHVNKLSQLCSGNVDYAQLKNDAKQISKHQQPAALKVSASKTLKKQVLLAKQSLVVQQDDGKSNTVSSERLPNYVSKSNIYKYGGLLFQGMSIRNAMFSFAIVSAFKKRTETVIPCIGSFGQCNDQNFATVAKKVQNIYDSLPKSLLERISDFIKKKLYGQVIAPLKKKLIDFLKKSFMQNWMKKLAGMLQQFLQPVIDKFIEKAQSLGHEIARGIKVFSKALFKIAKIAYALFKVALKGVMALIKMTLKLTFKAITATLQFAAGAFRLICKFIYAGMKFIGKLFSKTGVGKFIGKLAGKVRNAVKNVVKRMQKVGQKIGKVFSKMKNALKSGLKKLKSALKNGIKKVFKAIKNVIKKVAKKIVSVVKNTIKKAVQKIMRKLGLKVAKKVAKKKAKSLMYTGVKKLVAFLLKWVVKFIAKIAGKAAAAVAVNAIPIIGQIISAGMMIYTIVDTIYTFYEVYKFMKDNPEVWAMVKEKVAEYVAKSVNFIKGICDAGKRWFYKVFVNGPKKLAKKAAHFCNFLLNPLMSAEKMLKDAAYVKELSAIRDKNLAVLNAMDAEKRAEFLKSNTKSFLDKVDKLWPDAEKLTIKIEEEQNSWWPSNKKIVGWIDQRQTLYRQMMDFASKIGLSSFSKDICKDAFDVVDAFEKKQQFAEQIARRNAELKLRYENKRIDLEELQKICKDLQDKTNAIDDGIKELDDEIVQKSAKMLDELEELYDAEPDDLDETYVIAG